MEFLWRTSPQDLTLFYSTLICRFPSWKEVNHCYFSASSLELFHFFINTLIWLPPDLSFGGPQLKGCASSTGTSGPFFTVGSVPAFLSVQYIKFACSLTPTSSKIFVLYELTCLTAETHFCIWAGRYFGGEQETLNSDPCSLLPSPEKDCTLPFSSCACQSWIGTPALQQLTRVASLTVLPVRQQQGQQTLAAYALPCREQECQGSGWILTKPHSGRCWQQTALELHQPCWASSGQKASPLTGPSQAPFSRTQEGIQHRLMLRNG